MNVKIWTSICSSFLETSPLVTFVHAFITDIDYIHYQACGEDVVM